MDWTISTNQALRQMLTLLALVLILMSGCAAPDKPEPTAISPLPSPQPTQVEETSPLPTKAVSELPTPEADSAIVTGKLVRVENGAPVVGVMAFLERTTEDHRVPPVLYAPPNDQPSARTNETGEFAISDVPPDEYVVILYSPPYALQVITQADGDQPLLVNTEAGEVTDVGTVKVTEFELP